MPQAARLADPIGHSPSMNWLLAGVVAGAAIAVAGVAIVGTGGLAAAAIVGGAAALGGGLGETLSTMSWAPKEVCGTLSGAGSDNVFINSRPTVRARVDFATCGKHTGPPLPVASGSATVFVNGLPAARVNDKISCAAIITSGSDNVCVGGSASQTGPIYAENLIPGSVQGGLLIVGAGSALMLGGWLLAITGLVGGLGGGYAGNYVGGKVFGEGSDRQKWLILAGGLVGGLLGGRMATPRSMTRTKGPATDASQNRRAYLNRKFDRTGDLHLDINIRGRQEVATNFFRSQGVPESDIPSYMTGIDFTQPVEVQTFGHGKRLWQYQTPGAPQGNWYSLSPSVKPTELGISPFGLNRQTGAVEPKVLNSYVSTESVPMLRSTSAAVSDFWSVSGQSHSTIGGARQLFTTKKPAFALAPNGSGK